MESFFLVESHTPGRALEDDGLDLDAPRLKFFSLLKGVFVADCLVLRCFLLTESVAKIFLFLPLTGEDSGSSSPV